MEKTDVGTDMRAPCEEEGGIIAQGRHDVNWIFPLCEVVMSKSGREESGPLAVSRKSCVRDSVKKGLDARGPQTELLASPLCRNRDFRKGEIGCLTGGSCELYMSR